MKIIIDEGISESSPLFISFLKYIKITDAEFLFLSKNFPGIPDVEILDKLLPNYRNLLTSDRVLHNQALAKGFTSFILDKNDKFTGKPLAGIVLKEKELLSVRKELETDYLPKFSDDVQVLINRILEIFPKRFQENTRTKRRRIRSYFGDIANISSLDFTIGSYKAPKAIIGGYYLKITAKNGLKALQTASEG